MPLHHYLPAAYLAEFSIDETTFPRRNRILSVGNKENSAIFQAPAKKVAAKNNLYTVSNVGENEDIIDDIWSDYENKLNRSIDQLINQEINGSNWGRVLIPFVAAMLVRTPDFNRRFVDRLKRLGINPGEITKENINLARTIDLQRLLGPVSAATWTIQKTKGGDPLITNDLGYSLCIEKPFKGIGFAIPLNKTHILTITPEMENKIGYVDGNVWKPNIQYIDLPTDAHERFNHLMGSTAVQFIFGAEDEIIQKYLTRDRHPFLDSPFEVGLLPGKYARAFEFTWHRLIPALERNPNDGGSWDFSIDFEQLSKGWVPPLVYPTNLPEFPSALRREGDSIIAEFYNPEVYYILSGIVELEQMNILGQIPIEAQKGLEIAEDPEHVATFLIALGNYDLENEAYDSALAYYNKAIEADPSSDIALANKGTVYSRQERFDLAIAEYKKAISVNPENGFCFLNLGQIYLALEDWERADEQLTKAIQLVPPGSILGSAYLAQALLYENQEEFNAALVATDKALRNYKESNDIAKCWHSKSSILLKQDNIKKAQKAVLTSIEYDPQSIDNHLLRAHILLKNDKSGEAIKYLEDLLTTEHIKDTKWYVHNQISKFQVESGNLDKAIEESKKAIELDTNNLEFIGQLGFVYLLNGDLKEAVTRFDQILEMNPHDYFAHLNKGIALNSLGETKEAIGSLENAIQYNDDDDGCPERNLAKCYLLLHDIPSATTYQEEASAREPDSIHNSRLIALIKIYNGDLEEALVILQSPGMKISANLELSLLLPLPLIFLGKIEDAIQITRKELDLSAYPITQIEFVNQLKSIGDHLGQIHEIDQFISSLDLP